MFLDTAQKQAVSGIAETGRGVAQRRAQVILLYDEGLTTIEVAGRVGMSRRQVRYWKQQFHEHGLAIFSRWNGEAADAVEETGTLPEAPAQAAPSPAEEASILPLPGPLDHPGVTPDDSLAEAGRKVMLFQFNEMLSHEAGTRLGADIEELHDMRVATRRMRAAFDVFGEAFHAKVVKTHLKGLRATGRALGRVRDLDVFIEKAEAYRLTLAPEAQPGLDLLLEMWGRETRPGAGHHAGTLRQPGVCPFQAAISAPFCWPPVWGCASCLPGPRRRAGCRILCRCWFTRAWRRCGHSTAF